MDKEDTQGGELMDDGLPKILPPYENGIFQAVLTLPEAHDALVGLVAAILGRPVKTVALRNNDAPSRDRLAKREQYDINCVVDAEDGDQFAIEMQATAMAGDDRTNDHKNIKWRSVYNLCDLHSNQPGRGLDYGEFVKSYQVMLCNYKVFDYENELAERFVLRSAGGKELCDAVTVIFVDLTKAQEIAKKPVAEMSDIEGWSVFLSLGGEPRYRDTISAITKAKGGIAVANETLITISQDANERARYRSRRIWLQDREHERAVALKEGRKEAQAVYEPIIASKDAEIANKDVEIANMAAEIAALRARLGGEQ